MEHLIIWVKSTQSFPLTCFSVSKCCSWLWLYPRQIQFSKWQTQWDTVGFVCSLKTVLSHNSITTIYSTYIQGYGLLEAFWQKIKLFLVPFKVLQCLCHVCTTGHLADLTKDLYPAEEVAEAKQYMALDVCQLVSWFFFSMVVDF